MIKKMKMDWLFISGIICLFLFVLIFHTNITLQKLTEAPSEKWGRAIKLGESTVVSPPNLKSFNGGTDIEWASADGIHQIKLSEDGKFLSKKIIKPSYMNFSKLISYQQAGDTVGWLEGPELKITTLLSENSKVKSVNSFLKGDIREFELSKIKDKIYLACVTKSELAVFQIEGGNLVQLVKESTKNEIVKVSMSIDNNGKPIVAYAVKTGKATFSIEAKLLKNDGSLYSLMKVHNVSADSTTNTGTESLTSIDTIFDGEKLWIAYEIGISSSINMQGKVYYGYVLPSGSKQIKAVDFKQISFNGVDMNKTIISDFSFIKNVNSGYIESYFGFAEKGSETMQIFETNLSENILTKTPMSNNDGWNKYPFATITADGTGAGFLKIVGGQSFEVYFTGDYEIYKNSINKATWTDFKAALSNNIIYLIIASLLVILNIPYFLIVIFILILLLAFKSNWMEKNYNLAFILTGVAHLAIKTFVFSKMVGPNVAKEMPTYLSGGVAYFATFTAITLASFVLVYFHVQKDADRNTLKEYFMAMVLDIMISMFLLGPFVFDKI